MSQNPVMHFERLHWKHVAIVAAYFAFWLALVVTLGFLLRDIPAAVRALLLSALFLVGIMAVLVIPLPGFRLAILNPQSQEVLRDTRARCVVLWGLVWRVLVTLPVTSILFGLGHAVPVGIYNRFTDFFNHYQQGYVAVTFACFFVTDFLLFYPLVWWWRRLRSERIQLVAATEKGTEA